MTGPKGKSEWYRAETVTFVNFKPLQGMGYGMKEPLQRRY